MHSAPRVLFVLKYREQPGDSYSAGWGDYNGRPLHSGLFNSARMVCEMLEANGVISKLVHVTDNNAIHREIVAFGATIVIIEAYWVVPEKFDVLRKACPGVKFVVRNHSEVPFLANEGMAFDWSMRYAETPDVSISCNAPRMLNEMRFLVGANNPDLLDCDIAAKVPYLPNYYPHDLPSSPHRPRHDGELHVGCFGAIRPLKNHIEQAIAALKVAEYSGRRLSFYVNAGRVEMNGSPILKNLREMFARLPGHSLVEVPWRTHTDFRALVATMDLVTQCSFSETFCIVAADAVSQGVPTVTSKEVAWSSGFAQADPTSSDDIARAMRRLLWAKRRMCAVNPSLSGLRRYSARSRDIWLRYIETVSNTATTAADAA